MTSESGSDPAKAAERTPRDRHPGRGWFVGTVCGLELALVLVSGASGWWLANRTLIASQQSVRVDDTVPATLVTDAQMPDVRGLDRATAEQVLADSGIEFASITIYDAPSVDEPGLVVEQSPAFGATDVATVELGLAVPVTMPDLVGMSQDEAVATLSGLGAGVDVVFGYAKDVRAGVVMSESPKVGEPLGQSAVVTIATAGSTVPLGQLEAIDNRCGSEANIAMDGRDYTSAVICRRNTSSASDPTWILSGSADRFTATVGVPDDGVPGTSIAYEVLLDGTVVTQGSAVFGSSTPIDIACSEALQLTLRIDHRATDGAEIAFGEAVLYGSDEGIARLSTRR